MFFSFRLAGGREGRREAATQSLALPPSPGLTSTQLHPWGGRRGASPGHSAHRDVATWALLISKLNLQVEKEPWQDGTQGAGNLPEGKGFSHMQRSVGSMAQVPAASPLRC